MKIAGLPSDSSAQVATLNARLQEGKRLLTEKEEELASRSREVREKKREFDELNVRHTKLQQRFSAAGNAVLVLQSVASTSVRLKTLVIHASNRMRWTLDVGLQRIPAGGELRIYLPLHTEKVVVQSEVMGRRSMRWSPLKELVVEFDGGSTRTITLGE